ncbi:F-box protein SKIP8 isoform X2 [Mercurialis annua]|uniref:F-box protein SKIP8 isoform X2 n=1 Tax=Mercurialis annua TaxID=3986 RepID=UPI002160EFBC|nr:F-box protein SKIP8 isoform X2 [Mercurialis annua]
MEITTSTLTSHPFLLASSLTLISLLLAFFSFRLSKSSPSRINNSKICNCCCHVNGHGVNMVVAAVAKTEKEKVSVDRQSGASMMEQLVPEITTHALSYLDYPSLCRLSMTNSLMRKAANDDNAWKALYHKDFTLEQDTVTPVNGWKAYYASTRAIVNVNAEFFNIIKERGLQAMSRVWLNVDYVKCIHASGELFSGISIYKGWMPCFIRFWYIFMRLSKHGGGDGIRKFP